MSWKNDYSARVAQEKIATWENAKITPGQMRATGFRLSARFLGRFSLFFRPILAVVVADFSTVQSIRKNRTKVRGTQCATLTRGIVPQIGVMPDEPRATDFCALCSIFSVPASLGLCRRLAAPVTGCGAVRSRYNVGRGRFAAWAAPPLRRSDHGCKHHQRDVQRFTGGNRNHRPFAGEEGMTTANRDLAKKKPGHPGK